MVPAMIHLNLCKHWSHRYKHYRGRLNPSSPCKYRTRSMRRMERTSLTRASFECRFNFRSTHFGPVDRPLAAASRLAYARRSPKSASSRTNKHSIRMSDCGWW